MYILLTRRCRLGAEASMLTTVFTSVLQFQQFSIANLIWIGIGLNPSVQVVAIGRLFSKLNFDGCDFWNYKTNRRTTVIHVSAHKLPLHCPCYVLVLPIRPLGLTTQIIRKPKTRRRSLSLTTTQLRNRRRRRGRGISQCWKAIAVMIFNIGGGGRIIASFLLK